MRKVGLSPAGAKEYQAGRYWSREEDEILVELCKDTNRRTRPSVYRIAQRLRESGFNRCDSSIRSRCWKLQNKKWNLDEILYYAVGK